MRERKIQPLGSWQIAVLGPRNKQDKQRHITALDRLYVNTHVNPCQPMSGKDEPLTPAIRLFGECGICIQGG